MLFASIDPLWPTWIIGSAVQVLPRPTAGSTAESRHSPHVDHGGTPAAARPTFLSQVAGSSRIRGLPRPRPALPLLLQKVPKLQVLRLEL